MQILLNLPRSLNLMREFFRSWEENIWRKKIFGLHLGEEKRRRKGRKILERECIRSAEVKKNREGMEGQYLVCKGKENGGRKGGNCFGEGKCHEGGERHTQTLWRYNSRLRICNCNCCFFSSQNQMNGCLSVIIILFIVTSLFLSCCWSWQSSSLSWWRFLRWIYSQYPIWIDVDFFPNPSCVKQIDWSQKTIMVKNILSYKKHKYASS